MCMQRNSRVQLRERSEVHRMTLEQKLKNNSIKEVWDGRTIITGLMMMLREQTS